MVEQVEEHIATLEQELYQVQSKAELEQFHTVAGETQRWEQQEGQLVQCNEELEHRSTLVHRGSPVMRAEIETAESRGLSQSCRLTAAMPPGGEVMGELTIVLLLLQVELPPCRGYSLNVAAPEHLLPSPSVSNLHRVTWKPAACKGTHIQLNLVCQTVGKGQQWSQC